MNMRKKLLILGVVAIAVTALSAPAFAIRAIQGAVGEVSALDGAALGSVGFRIWSAFPGGESNINDNVASCRNVRCMRTYIVNTTLNPGGYVGNQENTSPYNGDVADQPFYMLADAEMNRSTGQHICYYGVGGVSANTAGVGAFLGDGCPGTQATNCFDRLDSGYGTVLLTDTYVSYGAGANEIRAIGGLNPVPTVRIASVAGGVATLQWDDPQTYAAAMRPSTTAGAPPSPVIGVRLWKNDRVGGCTDPAGDDPGWTPIGEFGLGAGGTTDALPGGVSCRFYALSVRLVGPGGPPAEVQTFCVGANSQPVSTDPTAVRIVRFDAAYTGRGSVNVTWQSGIEGNTQGYYVTQSTSPNGQFTRVSEMVSARGDNSNYSFTHKVNAAQGRVYYYQLEIVGRDGTTATTSPAAVNLPGRSKKGGPKVTR